MGSEQEMVLILHSRLTARADARLAWYHRGHTATLLNGKAVVRAPKARDGGSAVRREPGGGQVVWHRHGPLHTPMLVVASPYMGQG